jgi:hypothetical protein
VGGFKIELPPGVVFFVGVGDAALSVVASGFAVDGEGGFGVGVGAALGGGALGSEVLAGVEDLDLGELEEAFFAGELDADVACGGWGGVGWGEDFSAEVGEDEVAGAGQGAELKGGEGGLSQW